MYKQPFCLGIEFHETSIFVRSKLSLDVWKQALFFQEAAAYKIESVTILQTCNRTEVYGFGNENIVKGIFCRINEISQKTFDTYCFLKTGKHAMEHLFRVSAGLDSQIVGDLEILGQVKSAFKTSKQHKLLHPYMERLANVSIQASKEIRTDTKLSSGSSTFAYAAVKIVEQLIAKPSAKILLIGIGKFGSTLAKNIHDYLPDAKLTLCNRTLETSKKFSEMLNAAYLEFELLTESCHLYDAIITTVGVKEMYLLDDTIEFGENKKIIVDLSIPQGVNPAISEQKNIQLISMDDIALQVSESKETRANEIPIAEAIVNKHLSEFNKWSLLYDHRLEIRDFENALEDFSTQCTYLTETNLDERMKMKKSLLSDYVISMREVLQEDSTVYHSTQTLVKYGTTNSNYNFVSNCSVLDNKNGTCNKCKERLN
jgi:glutamyl-tRNA reductase